MVACANIVLFFDHDSEVFSPYFIVLSDALLSLAITCRHGLPPTSLLPARLHKSPPESGVSIFSIVRLR